MIYIFVVLLLLFFIFHFDIKKYKTKKNRCYYLTLIILILISGLRWRLGTDTVGSIENFFCETPVLDEFFKSEKFDTKYPLWNLLMSFIYTTTGKFYVLQLAQSIFVNTLIFKYFKRHSSYVFTCIFFYFIWMYTTFNMEEMKASMSVAVMLYAYDYIMDKKYFKAFLLFVIGCTFHFSTLFLFLTPFVLFLRLNKISLLFLTLLFFFGYYIQLTWGDAITVFDINEDINGKIEQYAESEKYSSGKRIVRVLICDFPIIVYSYLCFIYIKIKDPKNKILIYEPLLWLGIMMLILSCNILIFYRYFHFYVIYIILFVSESFKLFLSDRLYKGSLKPSVGLLILLPLMLSMTYPYHGNYYRYYPYCSVFNRNLDKLREQKQYEFHPNRLAPNRQLY